MAGATPSGTRVLEAGENRGAVGVALLDADNGGALLTRLDPEDGC